MEAAITPEEFGLVLRGWRDDKRRVRAVLEASLISFGVFGTVLDALDNGNLSISLNGSDAIGVSTAGCICGFLDITGEEVAGEATESGLIAFRPDFRLTVLLLAD